MSRKRREKTEEPRAVHVNATISEPRNIPETDGVDAAAAPTEDCTRHVADTADERCIRCSMPLSLMSTGQRKLAQMRRDSPVAALDEPAVTVHPHIVVHVGDPWHVRLIQLAGNADMSPSEYVERLIKRAWIASGAGKGES